MKKTIITYGTFDMFHIGHLNLLMRMKEMADEVIVAVSTDEFNNSKGKQSLISFEDRFKIVDSIKYVDLVIPEISWEQKIKDVEKYDVDIFVMGDDWKDKFDFLAPLCNVIYLSRTLDISTTIIKQKIASKDRCINSIMTEK